MVVVTVTTDLWSPYVCVCGTWLVFFILSSGRWTTWFDRVYLDACFLRHKVWWSAFTRNVEWSPRVKGLFLSPSLTWTNHCPCLVLCIGMAFLVKWVVWPFYVYAIWRREELLEISGSSLRDCSSPQTPAPLHRSLIKDLHCPIAAPLSAEGPLQICSEYLPVPLQVDSAQLSPRNGQNSGFQSAGPLAFPCLWEIKRGTSAWFTPPLFIPLHTVQKTRRWGGGEWRRRKRGGLRGVAKGWSQGHRVISEEQSGAPFLPPLVLRCLLCGHWEMTSTGLTGECGWRGKWRNYSLLSVCLDYI